MIEDIIIISIVVCIIGAIIIYLYRAKKRGETCIGCPYAKQCGSKCSGNCGGNHADAHMENSDQTDT